MTTHPEWRKSSRSNQGGNCVEVATNLNTPLIRDSKLGEDSPVLKSENFSAFLESVKTGRFE